MPNVMHPGFAPVRVKGGGTVTYARKRVLSNNSTAIALNDCCAIAAGGDLVVSSSATAAVATVSGGASYVNSNSERVGAKNLPASTTYSGTTVDPVNASYIFAVDNFDQTYHRASIDEAVALTDLNLNYKIVLGTAVNGISQHELDATSRATTNTGLPWRVTEFVFSPDNDVDAADAHVFCLINLGMIEPAASQETGT